MLALVKFQKDRVKSSFNLYDQANKRIWWMPRQLEAMKDVVACDKLGGAGKQALYPEMSEWGNPTLIGLSAPEYIGCRSKPGELNHLSTRRKRNQPRFP